MNRNNGAKGLISSLPKPARSRSLSNEINATQSTNQLTLGPLRLVADLLDARGSLLLRSAQKLGGTGYLSLAVLK
jgi:hypothetical protein